MTGQDELKFFFGYAVVSDVLDVSEWVVIIVPGNQSILEHPRSRPRP